MAIEASTRRNIRRDRRVQGETWRRTYNKYFSDDEVMNDFWDCLSPFVQNLPQSPKILYAGSGPGLLGEHVVKKLQGMGFNPRLTLVDASGEQLKANKNGETRKVHQDLLNLGMGEKFDLIIMRSTLDYFSDKKSQVKVLRRLRSHLSKGGFFVNQCASLPTKTERNIADEAYSHFVARHFQWHGDVPYLYGKAGFPKVRRIGFARPLLVTQNEHYRRYQLTENQVEKIRRTLSKMSEKARKNLSPTQGGYYMRFSFPIYLAVK